VILFLDDEPHRIEAYVDTISDAGLAVRVVTNRRAFLDGITTDTSAVIIDVMIDDGFDTGLEILAEVRRMYPSLRAILLTNRSDFGRLVADEHTSLLFKRDTSPRQLLSVILSFLPHDGTD
jgi:DNA-binding NtrC family response regulator